MWNDPRSFRADGVAASGKPTVCIIKSLRSQATVTDRDMRSYGVSRVYSQQCGYVLADTQSFRDKMKGVAVVMKELEIDPDAGKAR